MKPAVRKKVETRRGGVGRYEMVTDEKAGGATYTPKVLADFVATEITRVADVGSRGKPLRVLDPAIGDGELLSSLLSQVPPGRHVHVFGFDTDKAAVTRTAARLHEEFPNAKTSFSVNDFLAFVLEGWGAAMPGGLFESCTPESFDLIIANPPFVRTQVMGAEHARRLAKEFGLGSGTAGAAPSPRPAGSRTRQTSVRSASR